MAYQRRTTPLLPQGALGEEEEKEVRTNPPAKYETPDEESAFTLTDSYIRPEAGYDLKPAPGIRLILGSSNPRYQMELEQVEGLRKVPKGAKDAQGRPICGVEPNCTVGDDGNLYLGGEPIYAETLQHFHNREEARQERRRRMMGAAARPAEEKIAETTGGRLAVKDLGSR